MRTGLRRVLQLAVAVLLIAGQSVAFPRAASAATPLGQLSPGVYQLEVYKFGTPRSGSLHVTDSGNYQQTYLLPDGRISMTLAQSTDLLTPTNVMLTNLELIGIFFNPSTPKVWRPLNALGVMLPGATWSWSMTSSNGNVGMNLSARNVGVEVVLDNAGLPTLTQRIDSTLRFSGSATGTITHRRWEGIGTPGKAIDHFVGAVTIAGTRYHVDSWAGLGGL